MAKNILIYGESYEWAMAKNLSDSLIHLGYSVKIFDYTNLLYKTKEYTIKNRILDRIFYNQVCVKINLEFLIYLGEQKFDLVIILKGVHLFPETIKKLKNSTRLVVNWNPDDFFNSLNSSKSLIESFSLYDFIFTSRGHLINEYYEKGARNVELLNWYYLPQFHIPTKLSEKELDEFSCDISFIGTWSKRREQFVESLIDFKNVKIYGGGWNRVSSKIKKCIEFKPSVFSKDMAKVISASKININILTQENRDATNCRNFEILGCKGFQLAERSEDLLSMFQDNKDLAVFSTPKELHEKCEYYLFNINEREAISNNGYKNLINGKHTMMDRANQIVSILF
jgi:spore maturation protein CgeB